MQYFKNSEGGIYELYEKHYLRLFNLSYSILKDRMQAEEVMQDTLLKFFDSEKRFANIREKDKWLTKVCVNSSIDQLRKNQTEKKALEEYLEELPGMEDTASYAPEQESDGLVSFRGVTVKDLRRAVGSLAAGYRLMITLVHFEGYDYEEIAYITGLKKSTVRSQYTRAKQKLIEILQNSKKHSGFREHCRQYIT